jgi:hypothetical protein
LFCSANSLERRRESEWSAGKRTEERKDAPTDENTHTLEHTKENSATNRRPEHTFRSTCARSAVSTAERGHGRGREDVLRTAKVPPVKNPEMIALYGSSFCLYPFTAQSNDENNPPQTPKLPPTTGARALMAEMEPRRRSPFGELRAPLIPCQTVPPTAPMALQEGREGQRNTVMCYREMRRKRGEEREGKRTRLLRSRSR